MRLRLVMNGQLFFAHCINKIMWFVLQPRAHSVFKVRCSRKDCYWIPSEPIQVRVNVNLPDEWTTDAASYQVIWMKLCRLLCSMYDFISD